MQPRFILAKIDTKATGRAIGLDVGLKEFYTDSIGEILLEQVGSVNEESPGF